jgi:glucose-6-phosphate 1-dehydrogenase
MRRPVSDAIVFFGATGDLAYSDGFHAAQRLLGDAMHGIGDLFGRQDIVDAQWRIVDPVLDDVVRPVTYEQRIWGPEEAKELIGPDGPWHNSMPAALRP